MNHKQRKWQASATLMERLAHLTDLHDNALLTEEQTAELLWIRRELERRKVLHYHPETRSFSPCT